MPKIHSWCAFSFVLFICFSTFSGSLSAQNALSRISTVDRSDGKGAVIRYHFEEAVDSFEVIQPAPDLIQMVLYGDIDTTGIQMPGAGEKVDQVYLYELDYGFGVDIYIGEGHAYIADAYPDQNQRHLLVALTETSLEELDAYSQQFIAKTWYDETTLTEIDLPPVNISPETVSDLYNPTRNKLKFDKVVIDAGHGGHDPGNLGYKRGAKEKDVVLAIAKKLGNYIEEGIPGVEVIYTRETDEFIDLDERGSIANRAEADLFISIHADGWHQSSVRGASVFFLGLDRNNRSFTAMKEENQIYSDHEHELVKDLSEEDLIIYELAHSGNIANSERIAYMVEDQIKNRAQRKSRGVKTKGLAVLYQSTMPAILVETGFLTNPAEQRYLTSDRGQSYIASAIYRAVKQYKKEQDESQSLQANSAND
ncbi:MAG: N-acetylmuramoyl-L-alanine amidase [Balneola sp.]